MRLPWLLVPLAAVVLYLAVQPATRPGGVRLSGPAPAFELPALGGELKKLDDYKGQVVFLDFWATWCPDCRKEMPELERLYRRHREKGFAVVAVSLDAEGRRAVAPFAAEQGLTFPILLADERVPGAYGVRLLPTAFLLDASGTIVRRYVGAVDSRALENDILGQLNRRNS